MSVESVHSLRDENVEFKKLEGSKLNSRQSSTASSRQSQFRSSSVVEGLLETLALQQDAIMKTLTEQSTSTHSQTFQGHNMNSRGHNMNSHTHNTNCQGHRH